MPAAIQNQEPIFPSTTGVGEHSAAAPIAISLPEQIRLVSEVLHTSLPSGPAAEQARTHLMALTAFLRQADTTLSRVESFGTDKVQEIRSVRSLNDSLVSMNQDCGQVVSVAARIQSDIVSLLQGPRAGEVAALMKSIAARAENSSLATMQNRATWTEQIFEREVHDMRVAKVQAGVADAKDSMAYYLKQAGIQGEALAFITKNLNRRLDRLAADLVRDPVNGKIDPDEVRSLQQEILKYARVEIPLVAGAAGKVDLPEGLRNLIANRYGSLKDTIDVRRKPDSVEYTPASGVSVLVQADEVGHGKITITDSHTASVVTYTIADRNPSAYGRVEAIKNIRSILEGFEREDGPKWTRGSAENVRALVQAISQATPETESKTLPLPKAVPGFYYDRSSLMGTPVVLDIMTGKSIAAIVQQGVDKNSEHRVTLKVEDGILSVSLTGPRHSGLSQRLEVSVEADASEFRKAGKSFEEPLQKIVKLLDAQKVTTSGILTKEDGLIRAILAIPGAKVKSFKGVALAADADVKLELAAESSVFNVRVHDRATLRYSGEGARAKAIRIEDVQSSSKSKVDYHLKNAVLINCIDHGQSSGRFHNTHFERVQLLGVVQDSLSGTFGASGAPIAEPNCSYEGCGWRTGFWNSVATLGRVKILALKKD